MVTAKRMSMNAEAEAEIAVKDGVIMMGQVAVKSRWTCH